MNKVPPHDAQAERALLGSTLMDNKVLLRVGGIVQPEDFYYEQHRRIFAAMRALASARTPIDPVTLGTRLLESGELDKIGGAMAINDLLDGTATAANAEHYAQKIAEKAVVRRLLYAASEVVATAYSGYEDFNAFVAAARESIVKAAVATQDTANAPRKIDEDLKEAWRNITEGREMEGVIKTGIDTVDRTTGGLFPGLLTVLAGRPSMGKSCVGLNIAINVAKQGKKVLLLTMEDTRYFVVLRLLARFADIDLQRLTLSMAGREDYPSILNAITKLTDLPFWVDDTSGLTVDQIRSRVAAHREEHGLDLLVVDHLLEIDADAENETLKVSKAAAGARDIAKELYIPVLLLHQLNRGVEQRSDKRPMLSDLKQTGKVEEVARQVWFLFRPAYYDGDGDESRRDIQMIIAKSNHGRTGVAKLWGDLSRMYVRGWSRDVDGAFPEIDVMDDPAESSGSDKPWTPVSASHLDDY